jgi:hypothetical protein
MRLLRPWIVLVVAAWPFGLALAQEGGRTILEKGLFSYEAPPGWHVTELNLTHPVSAGPARDGFAANIHVDITTSALPLEKFVAENIRAAQSSAGFQLVSESPYSTAAGLDGTRVVVTETVGGLNLQQAFYFFDGGNNQKIVLSAACLTKDGAVDAAMFDASVRTFSLE